MAKRTTSKQRAIGEQLMRLEYWQRERDEAVARRDAANQQIEEAINALLAAHKELHKMGYKDDGIR